jgi:hypothetical protein
MIINRWNFKLGWLAWLAILSSLVAGCVPNAQGVGLQSTAAPQGASPQLTVAATEKPALSSAEQGTESPLATPYASSPAAGICAGPAPEMVVQVEIWPDIPSPRCLQVTPEQRLEVVNRTQDMIHVRLGNLEADIQPGGNHTFDVRLGDLLAPGVHRLEVSPYSGPEIVLTG